MIRLAYRRCAINSLKCFSRRIHGSFVAFNEVKKAADAPVVVKKQVSPIEVHVTKAEEQSKGQKKKKKYTFSGILFRAAFLASVAYGGTLFVATKNDKVLDFVIDQQPPYYEELLNFIENFSVEDLKDRFQKLKEDIQNLEVKLPSKDKLGELTQRWENKGESLIEETKKKLTGSQKKVEDSVFNVNLDESKALPAQQLQKPVEAIQKTVEHLPLIKLKKGSDSAIDSSVKSTIDSLNDLIKSIEVGTQASPTKEGLIREVNESISKLSDKLNNLTLKFDDELQSKLKISQTELLSSFTKKELDLTENLLHQFNDEKAQLERKLNTKLVREIEAAKLTISQAAVNAISMMRIEQTKQFEKMVKEKIDQERDGRLANLEKLDARLSDLEKFATSLETQLAANNQKSLIQRAISKLNGFLYSASDNNENPKPVAPYVDELTKATSGLNDDVFDLALKDLKPLFAKESNQSLLTTSQLLTRWEQLVPELRSASLLPPNAGLLGHLASVLFSKLLLPVKGSKPDGKDIESVIGRVEASLARNNLDDAVEEVANLKGWTRKLADDWIIEARKRLEVEFLLDLIETEARIL